MNSNLHPVLESLSAQVRHQVRMARSRGPLWIPWIFAVGLGVSAIGLALSVADLLERRSPAPALFVFAAAAAFFGWTVAAWLLGPIRIRPRIVPYFTRELGKFGGPTLAAFRRGRGLYREIAALEELAGSIGVKPLSAFGFAYDHYDQEVRWHPAAEGLRTAEALRQGLGADLLAKPDVVRDLDALASVLRVAAEQSADFSLTLRLHSSDSLQAVCTREHRQGHFW